MKIRAFGYFFYFCFLMRFNQLQVFPLIPIIRLSYSFSFLNLPFKQFSYKMQVFMYNEFSGILFHPNRLHT